MQSVYAAQRGKRGSERVWRERSSCRRLGPAPCREGKAEGARGSDLQIQMRDGKKMEGTTWSNGLILQWWRFHLSLNERAV